MRGNACLASADLAAEVECLRDAPGRIHPVLVGGGIPFFPRREHRLDVGLVANRTFSSGVVYPVTASR